MSRSRSRGGTFEADVYAEGNVRLTGRTEPPRNQFRTRIRSAKGVQVTHYQASGITQLKAWSARTSDPGAMRNCFVRGGKVSCGDSTNAPSATGSGGEPARDAGARNRDRAGRAQATPLPDPPLLEPVPEEPRAERDTQVRKANLIPSSLVQTRARCHPAGRDPPAAPATPPTASPASPPGDGEPPIIDLPPIEGAKDVEVPNLRNQEDVPRVQPLPGCNGRPARTPVRAEEKGPKKKPAPGHGPASAGSRSASRQSGLAAAGRWICKAFPCNPTVRGSSSSVEAFTS